MKISSLEQIALNRIATGGVAFLRTELYSVDCKTIDALIRKGLLTRDGLSAKGRKAAIPNGDIFPRNENET